jgi:hypothetical protein
MRCQELMASGSKIGSFVKWDPLHTALSHRTTHQYQIFFLYFIWMFQVIIRDLCQRQVEAEMTQIFGDII